MKYEFTKDYLTGIDEIDAEHQKLFDLTNECYELVMESAAEDKYDQIVALLGELRDYAATHFANEEAYMEKINYDKRFSERYLDAIDENQQEELLKILDFLARWLFGHIKGMDCRIPKAQA